MVGLLVGLMLPASAPAGRILAQTDSRLVNAVRLAHDGMSDSARSVVARILAATPVTDSIYAEVLYTTGLVAASERDRRLALRRVVVDFAQSAWADDALLQLAQLDYASGNPEGTVRQADQLIRDYPESPLRAPAALWGARAASDRRDPSTACRLANQGLGSAGDDVEIRNQLEFQLQRCQGLAAMQADTAGRTDRRTEGQSGFFVQMSAVATQAAAKVEIARARRSGFSATSLRQSGLYKIRIGPYPTRGEADQALGQVRSRLGGRPFIVRVP